jgi:hypothetical protein
MAEPRRSQPNAVLQISGLNVYYGRSHALQGVDLTLEHGVLAVPRAGQAVRQTTNRPLICIKRHINDPEFASAVVTAFRALNGRASVRKRAAR